MKSTWNKIKSFFGFIDLTTGSVTKKLIIFIIPVFITLALTNGLNFCNTMVLKHTVGGNSVTAINETGSLNAIICNFVFGCSSGFAVVGGQFEGKKDEKGLAKSFTSSFLLTVILSLIFTIIGLAILKPALGWLNIPEIYLEKAYQYFFIYLCGLVFIALNNLVIAYLRILGSSFFPMLVVATTTGLHILVTFLLTSKNIFNLDTIGCAISNLTTNIASLTMNYIYLIRKNPHLKFKKESFQIDKTIYGDLLKQGLPLGFQWSILFIGSFVLTSQINLYGAYAAKGVVVYSNVESLSFLVCSAISAGILSFVSQNHGSGKYNRVKEGLKKALIIEIIGWILMFAIGYIVLPYTPNIFLPHDEVNSRVIFYATTYLYILYPSLILQHLLTMSRSTLQGIEKPLIPMLSGIGELVMRICISLFLPYLIDHNYKTTLSDASFTGIMFSTCGAWLLSALIMGISVLVCVTFNKNYKDVETIELQKE